ncbi:MAG TPA: hypothetical protein VK991_12955 [Halomonas sp.]|nr:hypothetical protein [Halomonas sp.]
MHLFGKEWAMDRGEIHPLRVDVTYNEGRIRPYAWRFWRDFTGMGLRGLHYLPMFSIVPLVGESWVALGIGVAAVALFAPAYWLGWQTRWNTGAAEYIVGAVFGAALAAQVIIA